MENIVSHRSPDAASQPRRHFEEMLVKSLWTRRLSTRSPAALIVIDYRLISSGFNNDT